MKQKLYNDKKIFFHIFMLVVFTFMEEFITWGIAYGPYIIQDMVPNKEYKMSDMEFVNWLQKGKYFFSEQDPMIIISEVNCDIHQIEMKPVFEGTIPYIDVFFTSNDDETFNSENMKHYILDDNVDWNDGLVINLEQNVTSLRIDLGDASGLILKDIIVIVNPTEWHISISRIVAVLLIYIFSMLLFRLQESPNYDI